MVFLDFRMVKFHEEMKILEFFMKMVILFSQNFGCLTWVVVWYL